MKQHSCSESYYIEWREGSRRARLSVGKDAADASARRLRKEAELNALNNGVAILPSDGQNGHRSVAAAVAEFLDETRLSKKPKTLAAYRTALRYFVESCHKVNLEDIERKDLLKFSAFLRDEKGQSPRSCWNKFSNVMSFLKAQGIRGLVSGFKARALLSWPKFRAKSLSLALRDDSGVLMAGAASISLRTVLLDFLVPVTPR